MEYKDAVSEDKGREKVCQRALLEQFGMGNVLQHSGMEETPNLENRI